MSTRFILLLYSLLLFVACSSPYTLLQEGKTEAAFEASLKRVNRYSQQGRSAKADDLLALRDAFYALELRHSNAINTLFLANTESENWLPIYDEYSSLLLLHQQVEDLAQAIPGFKPIYQMPELESLHNQARKQTGAQFFKQAEQLFPDARRGDKPKARQAHDLLHKALRYTPEMAQYLPLQEEMYALGTIRVLLEGSVNTHDYVSGELLRHTPAIKRKDWVEIHKQDDGQGYDYVALFEISNTYVSFNNESRSTAYYSKEIITGYETVCRKITQGDSTITVSEQVPIKETVYGSITSVEQYKEAQASLDLYLLPLPQAAADPKHIGHWTEQCTWRNSYEDCSGDSRALPHGCSGICTMYPFDSSMLTDVASQLRVKLLRELLRYSY